MTAPGKGCSARLRLTEDGQIDPGGRRKMGVVLPKVVCQREISVEEAKAFFSTGKTAELTDFVSRFGRPFAATLVLKDNGRHGFEFTPREGRQGAASNGKAAVAGKPKTAKTAKSPRAKRRRPRRPGQGRCQKTGQDAAQSRR